MVDEGQITQEVERVLEGEVAGLGSVLDEARKVCDSLRQQNDRLEETARRVLARLNDHETLDDDARRESPQGEGASPNRTLCELQKQLASRGEECSRLQEQLDDALEGKRQLLKQLRNVERGFLKLLLREVEHARSHESEEGARNGAATVKLLGEGVREIVTRTIHESLTRGRKDLAKHVADGLLSAASLQTLATRLEETLDSREDQRLKASGDTVSLADLLQALANRSHTGVLRVEGPDNLLDLHLAGGLIAWINPWRVALDYREDTTYIEGHVVPVDHLKGPPDDDHESGSIPARLLSEGVLEKGNAAEVMMGLGLDVLRMYLAEPYGWTLEFVPGCAVPEEFADLGLQMPVQRFLLRLFSRVDEWKVFEKNVYSLDTRFRASADFPEEALERLSEPHRRIRDALDVPRSPQEVAGECRLGTFDVCSGIYTLLCMNAVEAETADG